MFAGYLLEVGFEKAGEEGALSLYRSPSSFISSPLWTPYVDGPTSQVESRFALQEGVATAVPSKKSCVPEKAFDVENLFQRFLIKGSKAFSNQEEFFLSKKKTGI